MTRIKTVRERTRVASQLAGIVAVVVPPLGLVAAGELHRQWQSLSFLVDVGWLLAKARS